MLQEQNEIRAERLDWSPDVFVRDVDSDGLLDIIYGLNNGRLLIFFNQSSGHFTRLTTNLPRTETGRLLEIRDFDADGKQELLYYQYGGSTAEKKYIINMYILDYKKL